jgi:hypothetical protein
MCHPGIMAEYVSRNSIALSGLHFKFTLSKQSIFVNANILSLTVKTSVTLSKGVFSAVKGSERQKSRNNSMCISLI